MAEKSVSERELRELRERIDHVLEGLLGCSNDPTSMRQLDAPPSPTPPIIFLLTVALRC